VVEKLAQQIESELRQGRWNHCAVYEQELQRLWPLEAKDRQAKELLNLPKHTDSV
jgi:hypothetical protein